MTQATHIRCISSWPVSASQPSSSKKRYHRNMIWNHDMKWKKTQFVCVPGASPGTIIVAWAENHHSFLLIILKYCSPLKERECVCSFCASEIGIEQTIILWGIMQYCLLICYSNHTSLKVFTILPLWSAQLFLFFYCYFFFVHRNVNPSEHNCIQGIVLMNPKINTSWKHTYALMNNIQNSHKTDQNFRD